MSYKYPIGYPKHAMEAPKGRAIVRVLACVLDKLVATNDRLGSNHQITKFHALRAPNISVKDYLERIFKYASCSSECFVLALIYIDRVIQRNQFVVNSLNVHRVLITAIMLAAKFFDDQYYNNAYYAKVGGVPCNEMNSLELEFLFLENTGSKVVTGPGGTGGRGGCEGAVAKAAAAAEAATMSSEEAIGTAENARKRRGAQGMGRNADTNARREPVSDAHSQKHVQQGQQQVHSQQQPHLHQRPRQSQRRQSTIMTDAEDFTDVVAEKGEGIAGGGGGGGCMEVDMESGTEVAEGGSLSSSHGIRVG